jgi:hypothetical protein
MTPEVFGVAFGRSLAALSFSGVSGVIAGGLVHFAAKQVVGSTVIYDNGKALIPAVIVGFGTFLVMQAFITHEQRKKE